MQKRGKQREIAIIHNLRRFFILFFFLPRLFGGRNGILVICKFRLKIPLCIDVCMHVCIHGCMLACIYVFKLLG